MSAARALDAVADWLTEGAGNAYGDRTDGELPCLHEITRVARDCHGRFVIRYVVPTTPARGYRETKVVTGTTLVGALHNLSLAVKK